MTDSATEGRTRATVDMDRYREIVARQDWHEFWADMRRRSPGLVHHDEGPHLFSQVHPDYVWQALHRDDVVEVLRDGEHFVNRTDLGVGLRLIPLDIDRPAHVRYRKLLDPLFAPKAVAPLEARIAQIANARIDAFADRGECDFVPEFAQLLPSEVFLSLLGLPLEDLPRFLEMKDGCVRPQGSSPEEMHRNHVAATQRILEYYEAALGEREKSPREDLLSYLLTAEVDGDRLTREEIVNIAFLLLIAGLDTVTSTLSCDIHFLATHPEHRRQIVEDPTLIPGAVEELLRYESPVFNLSRVCVKERELNGCPVKTGDRVYLNIFSANNDEAAVENPDVVDFRRSPNPHYGFGGGIHRCLGSHLARLELAVALREWHRRIPEYAVKPGAEPRIMSEGVRMLPSLPLVFG